MNLFLQLPISARLAILFVVGVMIATQINRAIYRLAWFPRHIGPWSPPHPDAPPRTWHDRLPILGWISLRRESSLHGRGFWIRPLLLELATGGIFAAAYWYEVVKFGVVGFNAGSGTLHAQCFTHLALFTLMLVATFIDFDEQTIPDEVTLPGTLLGLLIAAAVPHSRLLVAIPAAMGSTTDYLHAASGSARPGFSGWPSWLDGPAGLALGIGCFVAWCIAVMPWRWITRRGFGKAIQFWIASVRRSSMTIPLIILAIAGSLAISGVWMAGGERWESLLSSLLGMAVGGGTIWAVRIVGTLALKQEAMGFGDVTLMAMIGTFTGWQPTVIIFFLAPFSAILIAVTQFILTRRHDIAFGPYLCLATVFWIVFSHDLWRQYAQPALTMGWDLPLILGSCLLMMGGLLALLRMVRQAFGGG